MSWEDPLTRTAIFMDPCSFALASLIVSHAGISDNEFRNPEEDTVNSKIYSLARATKYRPTVLEPVPYSKVPQARQHHSHAKNLVEVNDKLRCPTHHWHGRGELCDSAACSARSIHVLAAPTEKNNMTTATYAAASPASSTVGDEFRRGWRTLLASSLGNGSGLSGLAFYTFGVFTLPLTEAFGWARGDVSIASSFLLLGTVITAPIVGSLIDRIGARRVALASMLLLGFGYAAMTQLSGSVMLFYAAWLALALIGGGTTPVVWTRAVSVWFDRGRGLALGIALAGSGIASMVAPAAVTLAISKAGWPGGYLVLCGFIVLVAVPLIALLFRDHPPVDTSPLAMDASAGAASSAPHAARLTGMSIEESRRSPTFWKIAIGFFFVAAVIAGLILNLVPLLVDRGMNRMEAAGIAGVMGIAVTGGRIGIGFLLDRLALALVARVLFLLCAIGCFTLSIPDTPTWVVALCVISLGLAAAAEVDMLAFLSARYFGLRSYGKVYGWQISSFYVGAALGPLAAGLLYNEYKSYLPMLYVTTAALVFGAIVLGTLGRAPDFSSASGNNARH